MRTRIQALDLLANNLSNSATAGFKADHEFSDIFKGVNQDSAADDTQLPKADKRWIDFTQGSMQSTGAASDLAISGKGFFVVDGKSGPLYTRNGAFTISPSGQLVTSDGYPLRSSNGTIQLRPGGQFDVGPDGVVSQDGIPSGKVAVVDFANPAVLEKQGNTYYKNTDVKAIPVDAGAQILQGKIELSNVSSADSAVRIVNVMRHFEALQKAVAIGSEMSRKAIEEVAKVS